VRYSRKILLLQSAVLLLLRVVVRPIIESSMHRILCLPRALFSERGSEVSLPRKYSTLPLSVSAYCMGRQALEARAARVGVAAGDDVLRCRNAAAAGLLPASAALPIFGRRHATRVTKAVASSSQLALTGQAPPRVLIAARQHVSAVKRMWCNLCKEMIDLTDTGVTHCGTVQCLWHACL